jgi:hypothetical protein
MATLISSGNQIGFTIMPYDFDKLPHNDLLENPSDNVIGYVTYNKETGEHNFTYTESLEYIQTKHWSLAILQKFPYCEQDISWIVYNCSPEKAKREFNKILQKSHETLHIDNWDIWSVEGKHANVAVITDWEIY